MLGPSSTERLLADLAACNADGLAYSTELVEQLLSAALAEGASDLHLLPGELGLEVLWRIDGVLQPVGRFPPRMAANVVARLKVLAELLTYRTDVPQEGRIRQGPGQVEMRVSTFPTLHGEKAVVRFFGASQRFERLDELGLPPAVLAELKRLLLETSGAILVCGPAGSGKTTTLYACLRELLASPLGCRSLVSLEDPIEVAVPGVAQSQIAPAAGFDLATGLRSVLRQDPEVILVGEIRDRETAEAAMQAALTGHLLLSSFHAGSTAEAIGRLTDLGIEPYLLRSGLLAILAQRLVRTLCSCARPGEPADALGLPVRTFRVPVGCEACRTTGYRGRTVLTEMLLAESSEVGRAILSRSDAGALERLAQQAGMVSRWENACELIESGTTSPAEVRRVLGFADRGRLDHSRSDES